MDGSENRAPGDAAEDWLRTRLAAQAADVLVGPPDIARIDARRRGIRNRRDAWAACAISAVTAGAVVTAVALAGGGDPGRTVAVPPATPTLWAPPTIPARPTETAPALTPPPADGPESPPPATGTRPGHTNPPATTAPSGAPTTPATVTTRPGAGPTSTGIGGAGTVAACTSTALEVSATKQPPDSEQPRHLLITVRNTGGTPCALHRYPRVTLGDAQAPAPVIPESDPDPGKPVTIAPGGEAHAAMVLNGPMDEYEVKSISLTLQGPTPGSVAGGPMDVPMPAATLYANDFQRVTYWTTASGLALDFVMSR